MTKPVLGKFANGDPVQVDVARLLETRLLVQAGSGFGKSWACRRLLEQTAGKVQQIIVDPDGEFASLREKYDYVIAAAHGGDAVAHPRSAALLARRLLETEVSAILDIYELKAHERAAFVRIFFEELVNAPKSLWHPALVLLDEAHVFCPEQTKAESTGAVIDLATRGRKRGFGIVLATQRLSKLNKNAAAEIFNKLIGRCQLDGDVKRAAFELDMTPKDALAQFKTFEPGDFFAFGPALSASLERMHVGDVKTTHPKAGQRGLRAPPAPTAAIKAMLPKLADLPKEAEQELRTAEDLRRELANVRRELTQVKKGVPTQKAPVAAHDALQAARAKGVTEGRSEVTRLTAAMLKKLRADLKDMLDTKFIAVGAELPANLPKMIHVEPQVPPARQSVQARSEPWNTARKRAIDTGDALTGPEQRILNAVAWLESTTGKPEHDQAAVAFLAGYVVGGGAFNNPRGRLNARGLVVAKGNRISLTAEGQALAQVPEAALTAQEMHQRVLDRLPGPERRILTPLLAAYPEAMEQADVAQAANYELGGGAFNNPRGRLRSLGLIEYHGGGKLRAADALFPS